MPSKRSNDWLRFQGAHVPGTSLEVDQVDRIQRFMLTHRTECLNDGERNLTIAGGSFALCMPDAFDQL
ncbi:hypothetical protein [Pseudomonas sp. 2FE]|uniref:hypothetical protein n=1 Tax=Pseudomonas sp. 2FE TaxID=2502190 RepID=UPI0010F65EA3|nr:hypothetical protein [Pseudomonas sp. 2FE]